MLRSPCIRAGRRAGWLATGRSHYSRGVDTPGLSIRPFTPETDYPSLAELITSSHLADGIDYLPTADNLRIDYEHTEGMDPKLDVLLAEVEGRLIGFGQVQRDIREGTQMHWTFGTVLPEYRRRGLGRAILHANEARLREIASGFEAGERAFCSFFDDKVTGALELFTSEGYRPTRWGTTMQRTGLEDVFEVPLPEGLEVRPVRPEDHRVIFDADNEAFRDHWGHREATDDDFARTFRMPELDTSLWRVAWDGDQVAGVVKSWIWREENEKLGVRRGWLEHISVRRPWRRRGLAKALIASALIGLRDAGMDEAMLGVDMENPSGAVGLYESVGFRVKDRGTHYRKEWVE